MERKPTAFEKLSWRFTPIGKVRLALSEEGALDSGPARQRLLEALALLDDPHNAQEPEARELLPEVLQRLAARSLDSDLGEAAGYIDRLKASAPAGRAHLELRWALVQKLIQAHDSGAVEQARAYLAEAGADPARAAELLSWALRLPDPGPARALAERAAPAVLRDPAVQTLACLSLQPECPADRPQAVQLAARLRPTALTGAKDLRFKAHLLRAQCCEAGGDWLQMAEEAGQAVRLEVDADRANYWRARALLHLQDPQAAAQILSHRPLTGLSPWMRLTQITALQAAPELTQVERCIQVLEGKWGSPDPVEKELAVQAVQGSLQPSFEPSIQQVQEIAAYSERLTRLVGTQPFLQINLALKELRVDARYEYVLARLSRGDYRATPWAPLVLLIKCACALLLGRAPEFTRFARSLEDLPAPFSADGQFFQAMQGVLEDLKTGLNENAAPDLPTVSIRPGGLVQALPVLSTLALFIQSLYRGECLPPPTYAALSGCGWAQWLWFRTWVRSLSDPAALFDFLDQAEARCPALAWDALALLQETQAVSPEPVDGIIRDALVEYKAGLASLPLFWQELVSMRAVQAGQTIGTLQQSSPQENPSGNACPWWLESHWLQAPAQTDAEVESLYLHGRLALRQGSPQKALESFEAAQTLLEKAPLAQRLSLAAAFLPYWKGAALAALGRFDSAAVRFIACLSGLKAAEARVQLGLIAAASGDRPAVQRVLESFPPEIHFPALDYLRALAAARSGQTGQALKDLDAVAAGSFRVKDRAADSPGSQGSPAYARAALRLRAALAEQAGELDAASAGYRTVLDLAPGDPAAEARLARLWAARKYQALQRGEALELPAPAIHWKPLRAQLPWTASLQALFDVLEPADLRSASQKSSARRASRKASPASPTPASQAPAPQHPALQRLGLRAWLQTRKPGDTLTWTVSAPEGDPELASLAALLRLEKALTTALCEGGEQTRAQLSAVLAELDALAAAPNRLPGLDFWRQSARQVLERPSVLPPAWEQALADEALPAAQRAWIAAWGLYSDDPSQRGLAAEAFSQCHDPNLPREDRTRAALLTLAAYVQGDDAAFLERYALLEADLEDLPYPGEDLYFLANEARLRCRQPDGVLQAPCPAALSPRHPRRLELLTLAHLQRAALLALSDPALAMEEVKKLTVNSSS